MPNDYSIDRDKTVGDAVELPDPKRTPRKSLRHYDPIYLKMKRMRMRDANDMRTIVVVDVREQIDTSTDSKGDTITRPQMQKRLGAQKKRLETKYPDCKFWVRDFCILGRYEGPVAG